MDNLLIDISKDYHEGGYCNVANLVGYDNIVFKQFCSKKKAKEALEYQKILAQYDFAPNVYGEICKLDYSPVSWLSFTNEKSSWGFITEKALPVNHTKKTMILLQDLVENIATKTKLKFWDCHWYNIGFVRRGRHKKLVCIDTGKESFNGYSNAWGNPDPGPKCSYCNTYECKCEE
jgi:hypothetical protein